MKSDIEQSYDEAAAAYAEQFHDELDHKPFDRKMLDWLLEKTAGRGTLCDMGCGPGQIARCLYDCGAHVCGIVSLDFLFFETEEMKRYLTTAGFDLEEVIERDPYQEVEYPSRRAYIFARKSRSTN